MISPTLLVDTFTPQTLTETADNMGGYTTAWTDGTAFKGRLSSLPIDERMAADKVTVYATHRLYCNNITVTEAYRIKLGTRYFEIKGVRNPSNISSHLELDVLEID